MNVFNRSDYKILIVDDNAKNIQVAMNILKDFNVIYAQTGQQALDFVQRDNFDLILLDIIMPDMDGYEVCKILKENQETENIPIIFLTVKDEEDDIVKGLEIGASDYVTKPFYPEVLLKRVEFHLKFLSNVKELKDLNDNLNTTVNSQIEDLREKDKIIFQQSKKLILNEMIDTMTEQLKYPLGLIKIQSQALELKLDNNGIKNIKPTINSINEQLEYLDILLNDFKSFFKKDVSMTILNLNVIIESVILFFKDIFIKNDISIEVKGDITLEVSFVVGELKHILIKLIFIMISLFKLKNTNNKEIKIFFWKEEKRVRLDIKANINNCDIKKLRSFLGEEPHASGDFKEFSVGLHIVNILIEKNFSQFLIDGDDKELIFSINF